MTPAAPRRPNALHSQATAAAPQIDLGTVALDEARPAALSVLDQGEIIELSIKPSPCYVAIVAARFAVVALAVAAIGMVLLQTRGLPQAPYVVAAAILAAIVRVGLASLQWASRVYVLTNRRVLRFSGTLHVRVAECPLARISAVEKSQASYQRLLGLGSIRMQPADERESMVWNHIARPEEVHSIVFRAVQRAQSHR